MSILYLRRLSSSHPPAPPLPPSSFVVCKPVTRNSWGKAHKSQKGKRKRIFCISFAPLSFFCLCLCLCLQWRRNRGESLWGSGHCAEGRTENIIIAQPNGNKFWHLKCHSSDNDHVKMLPHRRRQLRSLSVFDVFGIAGHRAAECCATRWSRWRWVSWRSVREWLVSSVIEPVGRSVYKLFYLMFTASGKKAVQIR